LYENWLFYAYPVTVLGALLILFMQRYVERRRLLDLALFLGLVVALALIWAAFHLVWVIATVILLIVCVRKRSREVAFFGTVAALIVFSVYAKNLVLFGTFGCGSVYPKINLAMMTTLRLPKLRRLVKEGKVSSTSLVPVFSATPTDYGLPLTETGIAVLDQVRKSTGSSNWHHLAYIEIADRYYRDALWALREHPGVYLKSLGQNVTNYFRPASDTYPFNTRRGNAGTLGAAVDAVDSWLTGRRTDVGVGWMLVVALPLVNLLGAVSLSRRGRLWLGVEESVPTSHRTVVAFCLGTVGFLFLVTMLAAAADQNRYRYAVMPCYLVLAAHLAVLTASRVRRRRSVRGEPSGRGIRPSGGGTSGAP